MKQLVTSVVIAVAACGCRGDALFEPDRFHVELVRQWAAETGGLAAFWEPELVCVEPTRPLCFCDGEDRERLVGGLPPEERLDLNRATREQLETLPGIGPVLAERVLDFRRRRGFRSLEDLLEIPGIGRSRYYRIASLVIVSRSR